LTLAGRRHALAQAQRSCRILVIDDDPLILSSTAALLADLGHSVIEAPSAISALEILRADAKVDAVVTDHAMPQMTGLELAGIIRKQWPVAAQSRHQRASSARKVDQCLVSRERSGFLVSIPRQTRAKTHQPPLNSHSITDVLAVYRRLPFHVKQKPK
jgi:CheY-like chemotaxis protein